MLFVLNMAWLDKLNFFLDVRLRLNQLYKESLFIHLVTLSWIFKKEKGLKRVPATYLMTHKLIGLPHFYQLVLWLRISCKFYNFWFKIFSKERPEITLNQDNSYSVFLSSSKFPVKKGITNSSVSNNSIYSDNNVNPR